MATTLSKIERVRLMTLGDKSDTSQDDLISLLMERAEMRLRGYINVHLRRQGIDAIETLPVSLEYIAEEIAIIRFNRIGSEGYASQSVGAHSVSFSDSDIDPFIDEILEWVEEQTGKGASGYRLVVW